MNKLPRFIISSALCLALSASVGAAAFAGAAPSVAQADDLAGTCAQLIREKSLIRAGEPSSFMLLLKLIFDRGSFVNPMVVDSSNPPDAKDAATVGAAVAASVRPAAPGKIRIFTLGHPEPVSPEDREILNQVKAEQKRQLRAINRLLDSGTAAECVAEAAKIGWSPEQLTDLVKLEDSALQPTRHEESQLSLKVAQKVAGHGKNGPEWEIVPVDSWGEIEQSLRQDPASGMILIAHADPNGRLYDSQRDELPTGFFRALPRSVRFVGVFSCESTQVVKSYGLDQLKGHDVVAVKLGAPFDQAETTPIQFFPTWVRKLEKQKFLNADLGSGTQPEAECSLSLEGLKLREGRLAVTIRGLAAGVWDPANESQPQLVPCSWLSDPSTLSVFAQPSQLGETVSFDDGGFSARALFSGESGSPISLDTAQVFTREDGAFRSAILSSAPSNP